MRTAAWVGESWMGVAIAVSLVGRITSLSSFVGWQGNIDEAAGSIVTNGNVGSRCLSVLLLRPSYKKFVSLDDGQANSSSSDNYWRIYVK